MLRLLLYVLHEGTSNVINLEQGFSICGRHDNVRSDQLPVSPWLSGPQNGVRVHCRADENSTCNSFLMRVAPGSFFARHASAGVASACNIHMALCSRTVGSKSSPE